MSIDTSLANPTSTITAWAALRIHLDAERATRNAALRRNLHPTGAPTPEQLRDDIARMNRWLEIAAVQSSTTMCDWIRARKAEKIRQLADLTAGGAA